ncbi:DUF2848 domain-containing protein [Sulfitobacter sp. R86518]|uniref:DUF2848 domain-containing protein n=1 Tax=Sulfitobacter sp. R86518 TaxID=3093858 RepID=UPI0036DDF40F
MKFSTGLTQIEIAIEHLVVAGWTGRDHASVQHHIDELSEIGVAPPSMTPLFYRVSSSLLTQADVVQVLGVETSGEAEPFLVTHGGKFWLGLASDHTDRELEATSVAASKQACAKVCATAVWDFDHVRDHTDQMQLRSWIKENGEWVLYQDGHLEQILPLATLGSQIENVDQSAMLCGTLPAIGDVRPAAEFRAELVDPVLENRIELQYRSEWLESIR